MNLTLSNVAQQEAQKGNHGFALGTMVKNPQYKLLA